MPVMRLETIGQILNQHAGVNGHVIHALLGLLFDDFEHYVGVQVFDALHARDRLINRHCPDRNRRVTQNGFANLVNVAAGRKIHDSVGAVMNGRVQLFELLVNVRGNGGIADIGVDLAQRRHADAHGLKFRVIDVRWNNHAAAGHFVANEFRRKLFSLRYIGHFFCDHTLAGIVHLGEIAVAILGLAASDPLDPWPGNTVSVVTVITVAGIAVRGSHDFPPFRDSSKSDYTLPNEIEARKLRNSLSVRFRMGPISYPA